MSDERTHTVSASNYIPQPPPFIITSVSVKYACQKPALIRKSHMAYPRPKRLCKTIRITFTIGETHSTLKRIINLLNRISNTTPIESLPLDAGASSPPSKMAARMGEDHHRTRNFSLKESAPIESPYRKIEIPAASLWWLGSRKTWLRSLSGCEDDIGPVVLFLVGFSFPLAIITVSR